MKATKTISAISLIVLLFGSATFAQSANNLIPVITPGTRQSVTFVVNINDASSLVAYPNEYFITVTNDRGASVAPPQYFHPGQGSYTFTEYGSSFSGNRTAHMTVSPNTGIRGTYFFNPQTIPGPFRPGNTYDFLLSPQISR